MFPFGVGLRKLSSLDRNSQVNEILFANYLADNNRNCFVIAHTVTNLLYVCVRFWDFLDVQKNNLKLCSPSQIWSHERVICISTRFPYVEFFFDVLIAFLNSVKLRRIEQYGQTGSLQSVDSDFFDAQLNDELQTALTKLALHQIPDFQSQYFIEFCRHNLRLTTPAEPAIERMEIEWVPTHRQRSLIFPLPVRSGLAIHAGPLYAHAARQPLRVSSAGEEHRLYRQPDAPGDLRGPRIRKAHDPPSEMGAPACLLAPRRQLRPPRQSRAAHRRHHAGSLPPPATTSKDCQVLRDHSLAESHTDTIFVLMGDVVEFVNSGNIPLVSAEMMVALRDRLA